MKRTDQNLAALATQARIFLMAYGDKQAQYLSDFLALKRFVARSDKEHYELVYIKNNIRQFVDFLKA